MHLVPEVAARKTVRVSKSPLRTLAPCTWENLTGLSPSNPGPLPNPILCTSFIHRTSYVSQSRGLPLGEGLQIIFTSVPDVRVPTVAVGVRVLPEALVRPSTGHRAHGA